MTSSLGPGENTGDRTSPDPEVAATLGLNRNVPENRARRRWIWLVLILATLGAGGFGFYYLGVDDGVNYRTIPAKSGDLTVTVTATGTLQPVNQVEVGSEVSGRIDQVLVDYNDKVEKGQILARLNTDQLAAQVAEQRAALKAAQATVKEAQATVAEALANVKRTKALAAKGFSSSQDLDTRQAAYLRAKASVASARAKVTVARARLDAGETNLKKAVIRSPINGIVISRAIEPGQTVAATFQTPVLFTLARDLTRMELHADIDEADVGKVRVGQTAIFSVDAFPGRRFPATMTEVRNAAYEVQGVVTYEGLLSVDNNDLALRPGMTATAVIVTSHLDNILLIPNGALRFTPPVEMHKSGQDGRGSLARADESRVWTLKDGEPAAIAVRKGATDGQWTEILSGNIKAGEPLLVDIVRAEK